MPIKLAFSSIWLMQGRLAASLYLADMIPLTIDTHPGCHKMNCWVSGSEFYSQCSAVKDDSLVVRHGIGRTVVSQQNVAFSGPYFQEALGTSATLDKKARLALVSNWLIMMGKHDQIDANHQQNLRGVDSRRKSIKP